jgi:hypothetical protein
MYLTKEKLIDVSNAAHKDKVQRTAREVLDACLKQASSGKECQKYVHRFYSELIVREVLEYIKSISDVDIVLKYHTEERTYTLTLTW